MNNHEKEVREWLNKAQENYQAAIVMYNQLQNYQSGDQNNIKANLKATRENLSYADKEKAFIEKYYQTGKLTRYFVLLSHNQIVNF